MKIIAIFVLFLSSICFAEADAPYHIIKLKYAYAPGIAQILGGTPLYYSDVDPWVGSIVGNRSNSGGRGFGGQNNQMSSGGSGFGGFSGNGQGFSNGF